MEATHMKMKLRSSMRSVVAKFCCCCLRRTKRKKWRQRQLQIDAEAAAAAAAEAEAERLRLLHEANSDSDGDGSSVSRNAQKEKRRKAAVQIQRIARGYLGRLLVHGLWEVTLQAVNDHWMRKLRAWEREAMRRELDRLARQKFVRQYVSDVVDTSVLFLLQSDASTTIQRTWRGFWARRHLPKRKKERPRFPPRAPPPRPRIHMDSIRRVWAAKYYKPEHGWPGAKYGHILEYDIWEHADSPPIGDAHGFRTHKVGAFPRSERQKTLLLTDKNTWVGLPITFETAEESNRKAFLTRPDNVQHLTHTSPYNKPLFNNNFPESIFRKKSKAEQNMYAPLTAEDSSMAIEDYKEGGIDPFGRSSHTNAEESEPGNIGFFDSVEREDEQESRVRSAISNKNNPKMEKIEEETDGQSAGYLLSHSANTRGFQQRKGKLKMEMNPKIIESFDGNNIKPRRKSNDSAAVARKNHPKRLQKKKQSGKLGASGQRQLTEAQMVHELAAVGYHDAFALMSSKYLTDLNKSDQPEDGENKSAASGFVENYGNYAEKTDQFMPSKLGKRVSDQSLGREMMILDLLRQEQREKRVKYDIQTGRRIVEPARFAHLLFDHAEKGEFGPDHFDSGSDEGEGGGEERGREQSKSERGKRLMQKKNTTKTTGGLNSPLSRVESAVGGALQGTTTKPRGKSLSPGEISETESVVVGIPGGARMRTFVRNTDHKTKMEALRLSSEGMDPLPETVDQLLTQIELTHANKNNNNNNALSSPMNIDRRSGSPSQSAKFTKSGTAFGDSITEIAQSPPVLRRKQSTVSPSILRRSSTVGTINVFGESEFENTQKSVNFSPKGHGYTRRKTGLGEGNVGRKRGHNYLSQHVANTHSFLLEQLSIMGHTQVFTAKSGAITVHNPFLDTQGSDFLDIRREVFKSAFSKHKLLSSNIVDTAGKKPPIDDKITENRPVLVTPIRGARKPHPTQRRADGVPGLNGPERTLSADFQEREGGKPDGEDQFHGNYVMDSTTNSVVHYNNSSILFDLTSQGIKKRKEREANQAELAKKRLLADQQEELHNDFEFVPVRGEKQTNSKDFDAPVGIGTEKNGKIKLARNKDGTLNFELIFQKNFLEINKQNVQSTPVAAAISATLRKSTENQQKPGTGTNVATTSPSKPKIGKLTRQSTGKSLGSGTTGAVTQAAMNADRALEHWKVSFWGNLKKGVERMAQDEGTQTQVLQAILGSQEAINTLEDALYSSKYGDGYANSLFGDNESASASVSMFSLDTHKTEGQKPGESGKEEQNGDDDDVGFLQRSVLKRRKQIVSKVKVWAHKPKAHYKLRCTWIPQPLVHNAANNLFFEATVKDFYKYSHFRAKKNENLSELGTLSYSAVLSEPTSPSVASGGAWIDGPNPTDFRDEFRRDFNEKQKFLDQRAQLQAHVATAATRGFGGDYLQDADFGDTGDGSWEELGDGDEEKAEKRRSVKLLRRARSRMKKRTRSNAPINGFLREPVARLGGTLEEDSSREVLEEGEEWEGEAWEEHSEEGEEEEEEEEEEKEGEEGSVARSVEQEWEEGGNYEFPTSTYEHRQQSYLSSSVNRDGRQVSGSFKERDIGDAGSAKSGNSYGDAGEGGAGDVTLYSYTRGMHGEYGNRERILPPKDAQNSSKTSVSVAWKRKPRKWGNANKLAVKHAGERTDLAGDRDNGSGGVSVTSLFVGNKVQRGRDQGRETGRERGDDDAECAADDAASHMSALTLDEGNLSVLSSPQKPDIQLSSESPQAPQSQSQKFSASSEKYVKLASVKGRSISFSRDLVAGNVGQRNAQEISILKRAPAEPRRPRPMVAPPSVASSAKIGQIGIFSSEMSAISSRKGTFSAKGGDLSAASAEELEFGAVESDYGAAAGRGSERGGASLGGEREEGTATQEVRRPSLWSRIRNHYTVVAPGLNAARATTTSTTTVTENGVSQKPTAERGSKMANVAIAVMQSSTKPEWPPHTQTQTQSLSQKGAHTLFKPQITKSHSFSAEDVMDFRDRTHIHKKEKSIHPYHWA